MSPPRLIPEPIHGEIVENVFRNPSTGRYYARKTVGVRDQRVISLRRKNFRSASEAKKIRDEVLAEVTGKPANRNRVSCEFVARKAAEKKATKGVRTEEEFLYTWAERLKPYWGSIPVSEVIGRWPDFVKTQLKLYPGRKLDREAKIMRFILGVAAHKENKWIEPLPTLAHGEELLPIPKEHKETRNVFIYTPEEIEKLYAAANEKWQAIFDLALHGIRQGTIRKTRYSYIDWRAGEIVYPAGVVKQRKEWRIAVDTLTLRRLKKRHAEAKGDLVFPRRDNPNLPMEQNSKQFYRIQKKAGVRKPFHWFRHTVASEAVRQGNHPIFVEKQLLMSAKTLKRYSHLDREDRRKVSVGSFRRLRKK